MLSSSADSIRDAIGPLYDGDCVWRTDVRGLAGGDDGKQGRAAPPIGVFAVAGTGAARLRRDPRVAADRDMRVRCRRADPAVQRARGGALGPSAAARPD